MQSECIAVILNTIRIRVKATVASKPIKTVAPPPDDNTEKNWREWIRSNVPRAVSDVLNFIEIHSGYPTPDTGTFIVSSLLFLY